MGGGPTGVAKGVIGCSAVYGGKEDSRSRAASLRLRGAGEAAPIIAAKVISDPGERSFHQREEGAIGYVRHSAAIDLYGPQRTRAGWIARQRVGLQQQRVGVQPTDNREILAGLARHDQFGAAAQTIGHGDPTLFSIGIMLRQRERHAGLIGIEAGTPTRVKRVAAVSESISTPTQPQSGVHLFLG